MGEKQGMMQHLKIRFDDKVFNLVKVLIAQFIGGTANAGSALLDRNSGAATGGVGGFQQVVKNFQAIELYYLVGDGFRRLLLIQTVICRNLGL